MVMKRTPRMRAAFLVELWVAEVARATMRERLAAMASSRVSPEREEGIVSRRCFSRAATMAVRTASEAEPWITPPPRVGPVEWKHSGRPRSFASQSRTMVSSSVTAGEQIQLKQAPLRAAL